MLIAIDLQNDYLDPKGKFFVPSSRQILPTMLRRIEKGLEQGELIAYTKNIYPQEEYEERSKEEILWAQEIHPMFKEALKDAVLFEKEHYGIPPEEALRFKKKYSDREEQFEAIEFIGVETNVCVLANLAIIQNIFPTSALRICTSCTEAGDPKLRDAAIEIMRGLKVLID